MDFSNELIQIFDDDTLVVTELDQSFKEKLSIRIGYLMQHQHQFLFNIFYRIDLNETKVKEALKLSSEKLIYDALADLVIARELKRQETRRLYSENRKKLS